MKSIALKTDLIATVTRAAKKPWYELRGLLLDVDRADDAWEAITGLWKGRRVGNPVRYQRRMRKELERSMRT